MVSLSREERSALRNSQGLLGTQQWTITGLRLNRERTRSTWVIAVIAAVLATAFAAGAVVTSLDDPRPAATAK